MDGRDSLNAEEGQDSPVVGQWHKTFFAPGRAYSSSEMTLTPLLVSTIGIGRSTPAGWFFFL